MAAKVELSRGISDENCKRKPLFLYYDCEAANSNVFTADIIEIAARCDPEIRDAKFESFISTSQELAKFTVERCGIKATDLEGQPTFVDVFNKFVNWIKKLVRKVNQKTGNKYFPVLCAHGGYGFDFSILLSNMKRYKIDQRVLKKCNIHFADTFEFCKKLQADYVKELCEIRLSMDSLYSNFCPGKPFVNRHRAMGDVNAMVEIFSTKPLKTTINYIDYVTSESLCSWFKTLYSAKEQKIILEEKMAKLDAYTKTVNLKKLVQIQLTYDGIQRIFENCCSFMDFYEAMKDLGIDRKTAKYFACQFGGLGLKNQGIEPYCNLPKPAVMDGEELDFSLKDVDLLLAKEDGERAVNVPPLPPDEFILPESTESWDCELDESRNFMLTVTKPVAILSLTVDDFVSGSSQHSKSSKKNRKTQNEIQNYEKQRDDQRKEIDTAKRTATSDGKVARTKNQEQLADVFRTGTSSLQIGKFSSKKERYELEKELLEQIRNVYTENEQGNSEKDKTLEQSKERMKGNSGEDLPSTEEISRTEEISNSEEIPRTEEILRTDPTSSINPERKPNEKKVSEKYKRSNTKPPRRYLRYTKPRNNKKVESSSHKKSSSATGLANGTVKIMKRNKTPQSNGLDECSEDTITSAGKPNRDTVASQGQQALKATEEKSSQNKQADSLNNDKREPNGSKPTNIEAQELVKDIPVSNGKMLKNDFNSTCSKKEKSKSTMEITPITEQSERKQILFKEDSIGSPKERSSEALIKGCLVSQPSPVVDKEVKSPNKDLETTKQDLLRETQNGNKQMSHSDLKTSKEQNDNVVISQPMETIDKTTEEKRREVGVTRGNKRNTKVKHGDKKGQKRTSKLRKGKRNREPVVFVDTSKYEKMKDWARVEVFIGDIPINVPVEPTNDDEKNEDVTLETSEVETSEVETGCLQRDNCTELVQKAESSDKFCCNYRKENEDICFGDINLQESDVAESHDVVSRKEDSGDVNIRGLLQTQLSESEQFDENRGSVSGQEEKDIPVAIFPNSVDNPDGMKSAVEICDVCVPAKEGSSLQHDFVCEKFPGTPVHVYSNNLLLQGENHNELPVAMSTHGVIKKTDASQQTNALEMHWYRPIIQQKKVVDHEQQTDCALYSTFNNNVETSPDISNSHSQLQDKEVLTDCLASCPRSSDTFSSYGDNVSDTYDTFPSPYESSSPAGSPATIQREMYLYDGNDQYDINTNVCNANEYESPGGVFNISMSPHREDRCHGEDTQYDISSYGSIPSPVYDGASVRILRKNDYSQTLPRSNVYLDTSGNPNVIPAQRFFTPHCTPVPPLFPMNPTHVQGPHVFPPRFPTQYIPRIQSTSNVLPCQYRGPLKF